MWILEKNITLESSSPGGTRRLQKTDRHRAFWTEVLNYRQASSYHTRTLQYQIKTSRAFLNLLEARSQRPCRRLSKYNYAPNLTRPCNIIPTCISLRGIHWFPYFALNRGVCVPVSNACTFDFDPIYIFVIEVFSENQTKISSFFFKAVKCSAF